MAQLTDLAVCRRAATLTESSDRMTEAVRAIWVGGAGDVVVTLVEGGQVTFASVAAGTLLPLAVSILHTETTATNIVGLY